MPKIRNLNPLPELPRPIGGTDLAIPFRAFGVVGLCYGDSFGKNGNSLVPQVGGDDWRSPIIVWTESSSDLGKPIVVTGAVRDGAQLWDYPHDNDQFSTVLPTDVIEIDGSLYIWVMVTKGLGHEQWCELARSDDHGITWNNKGIRWSTSDFGSKRVMVTFDRKPGSNIVDIFSTGGLARDKGMLRWRCHKDSLQDPAAWDGWGWDGQTWDWGRPPSEILPGWKFGEIGFRWIQGNAVLSGFDAGNYSIFVKVGESTDVNWTKITTYRPITGLPRGVDTVSRLYGGYVHPNSKFDGTFAVIVSEWASSGNPYRAMQFQVFGIKAAGPIVEDIPSVSVDSAALSNEGIDMSAEEALQKIAQELSASGDVKLTLANGRNVSLRQALAEILWKCNARLAVSGDVNIKRPVAATEGDDQFGHVLSARGELNILIALQRKASELGRLLTVAEHDAVVTAMTK